MGIFLVTVTKKYDFSSNILVLQSKKVLGFCKFINKGHKSINLNKWIITVMTQQLLDMRLYRVIIVLT